MATRPGNGGTPRGGRQAAAAGGRNEMVWCFMQVAHFGCRCGPSHRPLRRWPGPWPSRDGKVGLGRSGGGVSVCWRRRDGLDGTISYFQCESRLGSLAVSASADRTAVTWPASVGSFGCRHMDGGQSQPWSSAWPRRPVFFSGCSFIFHGRAPQAKLAFRQAPLSFSVGACPCLQPLLPVLADGRSRRLGCVTRYRRVATMPFIFLPFFSLMWPRCSAVGLCLRGWLAWCPAPEALRTWR